MEDGLRHQAAKVTLLSAINLPLVMRGLDPRIHQSLKESFEEDGLPGQARQ
jgi:hypothetical protein